MSISHLSNAESLDQVQTVPSDHPVEASQLYVAIILQSYFCLSKIVPIKQF